MSARAPCVCPEACLVDALSPGAWPRGCSVRTEPRRVMQARRPCVPPLGACLQDTQLALKLIGLWQADICSEEGRRPRSVRPEGARERARVWKCSLHSEVLSAFGHVPFGSAVFIWKMVPCRQEGILVVCQQR